MTETVAESIWSLVLGRPQIDPAELATALEREAAQGDLDFRTRLLIRDSLDALAGQWGCDRVGDWLGGLPAGQRLQAIWRSDLGPCGFPTISRRIMNVTRADTVLQFLREVSLHVTKPTRFVIGGSIALILAGTLSRHTEDIDVVDEVPGEIREQHELLEQLAGRYGLQLTHFQSHYLPAGWQDRVHSLGNFGPLEVSVVDVLDVFVGKLFSAREKDRDDLRALAPQLGKAAISGRLLAAGGPLLAEAELQKHACENWYVLYGESLPGSAD